jgi:hypothetical protein
MRKNLVLMGMAGVGGLLYLKVWLPHTGIRIPCVFREVTGLWCPGCGMTRLALSLMELDLLQAFRYNMLVFFLAPLYLIYLLLVWRGKTKYSSILMGAMVVMTIAFGVLRNIPYFAWLAPTEI